MFWRLSFRQPSAIDTLLDKEDCTLGEILDEDDVLQECKTQNKKLVDFLARSDVLEELIKLVTVEPENDVEDKVKFKYPHLACELLTSEVFAIIEQLSNGEHYLGLLWTFLDCAESLNPLIGSFISKVLAMLLNQKSQVIFDYMQAKEDFISLFLAHLGTSAMMDLLLQMVAAPDNDQCRLDIAEWLKDQGIVDKLIDFIHPSADPEQCVNASQALCDMIRLSREAAQMATPTPLLTTLESEETMQRLLDNLFCSEVPSDIATVNGINVLLTALERRQPNAFSPGLNQSFQPPVEEIQPLDNSTIAPGAEKVISVVVPRMKEFHDLLTRKQNAPPMVTTVGVLDPPLGSTRLQVVRLFSALLQCNNDRVAGEIVRLKTFTILMELFFEFPWNNFLHSQVECCISAALNSSVLLDGNDSGKQEDCPTSLRHHLIWECQIANKLLDGADHNTTAIGSKGGRRQGYMGHLIRIVNAVSRCMEGNEAGAEAMKPLDDDTHQKWSDFMSGYVAEMNKKNETNLGGSRPMASSMDDSDEEFDQLGMGPDSELEKAYQQFQEVKYVNALIDDYNVEDELNLAEEPFGMTFSRLMDISCTVSADEEPSQSATMFETACTERIQQFDDSESDDEDSSTWANNEVSFVSPVDQRSTSSDEDDFERQPREFQTSSSDEEEQQSKRAALYLTSASNALSKITAIEPKLGENEELDKNTISVQGVVTWRSDLSSNEDLTEVVAMDTGSGAADWTKEPEPDVARSPSSSWADFTHAFKQEGNERSSSSEMGMELEPCLEPSDIEVGIGEGDRESNEKERPDIDTSTYSPLSPNNSRNPQSPMDMDSTEAAPGSKDSDSSEQESDSDEERSDLNISARSDGEPLIANSPNKSGEVPSSENCGAAAPAEHDSSANRGMNSSVESSVCNPTETDRHTDSTGKNSPATSTDKRVQVNSTGNQHLEENFSFLSQGLLSASDGSRRNAEVSEVEQKRAEAIEACAQYEREVQGLQNK